MKFLLYIDVTTEIAYSDVSVALIDVAVALTRKINVNGDREPSASNYENILNDTGGIIGRWAFKNTEE